MSELVMKMHQFFIKKFVKGITLYIHIWYNEKSVCAIPYTIILLGGVE